MLMQQLLQSHMGLCILEPSPDDNSICVSHLSHAAASLPAHLSHLAHSSHPHSAAAIWCVLHKSQQSAADLPAGQSSALFPGGCGSPAPPCYLLGTPGPSSATGSSPPGCAYGSPRVSICCSAPSSRFSDVPPLLPPSSPCSWLPLSAQRTRHAWTTHCQKEPARSSTH